MTAWSTLDTSRALRAARGSRSGSLHKYKRGPDEVDAPNTGGVGPLLETIGAVVPTGVIAAYTAGALLMRSDALTRAQAERSSKAAGLAGQGDTAGEIRAALEQLPLESDHWLVLRWSLLLVGTFVSLIVVLKGAELGNRTVPESQRTRVVAEPVAAALAFATWALASPGTPLGALLSGDDTAVACAAVAALGGLLLLGLGTVSLTQRVQEPRRQKATRSERPRSG